MPEEYSGWFHDEKPRRTKAEIRAAEEAGAEGCALAPRDRIAARTFLVHTLLATSRQSQNFRIVSGRMLVGLNACRAPSSGSYGVLPLSRGASPNMKGPMAAPDLERIRQVTHSLARCDHRLASPPRSSRKGAWCDAKPSCVPPERRAAGFRARLRGRGEDPGPARATGGRPAHGAAPGPLCPGRPAR